MFRGRYVHTIDAKGRVSIPAGFRVELQHGESPPIMTNLFDCLGLYPQPKWLEIEDRLAKMSQVQPEVQAFQRFLVSGAIECPIDRQGRLLIPPHLREHAGLDREVAIAGVGSRVEIWDRERFDADLSQTRERSHQIASMVAELGL